MPRTIVPKTLSEIHDEFRQQVEAKEREAQRRREDAQARGEADRQMIRPFFINWMTQEYGADVADEEINIFPIGHDYHVSLLFGEEAAIKIADRFRVEAGKVVREPDSRSGRFIVALSGTAGVKRWTYDSLPEAVYHAIEGEAPPRFDGAADA